MIVANVTLHFLVLQQEQQEQQLFALSVYSLVAFSNRTIEIVIRLNRGTKRQDGCCLCSRRGVRLQM